MDWQFLSPIIMGLVRHGLTALAGALVSAGALQSDQSMQFVTIASGIAVWLIGFAWSVIQKQEIPKLKADLAAFKQARAKQAVIGLGSAAALFIAAAVSLALIALIAGISPAMAQSRQPRPALTGDPVRDIETAAGQARAKVTAGLTTVAQQIEGLLDTADAIKLATAVPGLQDTVGAACWQSFDNLSAVAKLHPLPLTLKAASDIEAARLFVMALNQICTNPNCGQMFVDATNSVEALNLTPIPLSLPSLCAKVPAIGTLAGAATAPVQPAANALGAAK